MSRVTQLVYVYSVTKSCLTLCVPMGHSTPGFPDLHYLQSLLRFMSIGSMMPSHPLLPLSPSALNLSQHQSFPTSQLFASGGQRTGVSASTSILPVNTQQRCPLGWTGWISLQSKGLSRVFSNTTVQKHQFFCTQLSL